MQRKCNCEHVSPPERVVRSSEFNRALSQYWCDRPLSGEAVVDEVLNLIYEHHAGGLFGPDGAKIVIGAEFDDLFGEDAKRFINRYREKATRLLRNRLQRRCVFPVMVLHFASQIDLCRTQGRCSR